MTIIWCMLTQIWSACTDKFLSYQANFCFFAPLLTPKINIWNKRKKTPGHVLLLHKCIINQDQMIYGSWDVKFNRICWSSLGFFCPFTPLTPWKMKISKMKKTLWISWFYISVPKMMIICYTVREIWCVTMSLFWAIFCLTCPSPATPFPLNSLKNENFKKMEKFPGDIIILHMCTKYDVKMMYASWDMVCDGWMDGRMDVKSTYRGGSPT